MLELRTQDPAPVLPNFNPKVVPAPAALHLRDLKETVTIGTDQFCAAPVKQVVGRRANAYWLAQQAQATLAALQLVGEREADA